MIVILLTAAVVLTLEFTCKYFVEAAEQGRLPRRLLGDRLRIEKLYNTGMMYGLGQKYPRLVLLIPVMVLLAAGGWAASLLRQQKSLWLQIGTGLVLGGGLANLLDRAKNGRVLDYIRLPKLPGKRLKNTVFNLADVAVFLGTLALLAATLRQTFGGRK